MFIKMFPLTEEDVQRFIEQGEPKKVVWGPEIVARIVFEDTVKRMDREGVPRRTKEPQP